VSSKTLADSIDALAAADAPDAFKWQVLQLVRRDSGMQMLVELLADEQDAHERAAILADMGELIDDHHPVDVGGEHGHSSDLSAELRRRREMKEHMRQLVERHGGVTRVAERAGMAQPSLSRLLNSTSQPRSATLQRLADAIGVSVQALTTPPRTRRRTRRRGDGVSLSARVAPQSRYASQISIGTGPRRKRRTQEATS